MLKKKLFIMTAVIMILSLMAGCNKNSNGASNDEDTNKTENESSNSEYGVSVSENDVTFTDYLGEEVTVKKNPQRVVCIYNSFLDIWDSCGGTVVGRVEESEDKPVESAMSAEVVGTAGAPSLEKILSLEPDLIIMTGGFSAQTKMIPTLKDNNIQVIVLKNDNLQDYYKSVRLFTAITGREDLYEKHIEQIKNGVDGIIEKAPKDKKNKVLILFASAKSLTVRNSDSMVGEMLKDLNTINISDTNANSSDSKVFSMEKILEEDPDFIFVQTMGSDLDKIKERLRSDAEDNPAWSSLKAVKNNRYIVLPKDLYMYKPNDRYPEAYEGLAKILYPEVFK